MKKNIGLFLCLFLLLVIAATAPFFSGWWFQYQYFKLIDSINKLDKIQIEVKSYERGWYHSVADLIVHIKSEKNKQISMNLHQAIQHGPLLHLQQAALSVHLGLVVIHNSFILTPEMQNSLLKIGIDQLKIGRSEIFLSYLPNYFGINLSALEWRDNLGRVYEVESIRSNGDSFIKKNKLSIKGDITLQRLGLDEASFRNIHLNFTVHQLNYQAISEMVLAYQKVLQQGEQYQGQLKGKLLSLLSSVLTAETSASINSFTLMTPDGRLNLSGSVSWSHDNPPDNLMDFIQQAPFTLSFRIPKPTMKQLLNFAANSPYLQEYSKEERNQLSELESNINSLYKMNAFLLSNLVYLKIIPEAAGSQLLIFQSDSALASLYFAGVKSLFLRKEISRETSYLLYFQFSQLQHEIQLLEAILDQSKENSKKKLFSQFESWVNSGYISIDTNDYVVKIQRKDDQVFFNGRN